MCENSCGGSSQPAVWYCAFVVGRINYLRFKKGKAEFDDTIEKLIAAAKKFDAGKIKADQIKASGGPAEE